MARRFRGCSDEEIRQALFTEAAAQLVYAREHGFDARMISSSG
jgi:hypothetical protein